MKRWDNLKDIDEDEIEDVLSYMTPISRHILLLANSKNREPIKGESWLQKELFLLSKNSSKLEESTSFESDLFGPFSEEARTEIDELVLDELLEKQGNRIIITSFGEEIVSRIRNELSQGEMNLIEDIKELLNDMTLDELLVFTYFTYPEMTDASMVLNEMERKRLSVSIQLYKKRKVSMEKAAELAGIPLERFMNLIDMSG